MPRISILACLLVLSLTGLATAQILVIEVGKNLAFNGVQAAEAVFQSAEWILDLTPLEGFIFAGCAEGDLSLMRTLAEQAASLSFGWSNNRALLDSLFAPERAPTTSFEFRERVTAINGTLYETYGYATDTQNLLLTAICTVEQILGFIETVSGLEGKLSVQQNLSQQLGKLHQLQTEGNLQRSAFERAKSLEGVTPGVLQQGIYNITDEMMRDHPRW
jgi:hypothetical protein